MGGGRERVGVIFEVLGKDKLGYLRKNKYREWKKEGGRKKEFFVFF